MGLLVSLFTWAACVLGDGCTNWTCWQICWVIRHGWPGPGNRCSRLAIASGFRQLPVSHEDICIHPAHVISVVWREM